MTVWDWVRVVNGVLFVTVAVLFGGVNWMRRDATDEWDAMARVGSWALFICLGYATAESIVVDAPTGPRLLPIGVCMLLITVAYTVLMTREIRKRKRRN